MCINLCLFIAEIPHVYCNKSEALDVLKLHKEARLREFNNENDAKKFANTGHEVVAPPRHADSKCMYCGNHTYKEILSYFNIIIFSLL